MKSRHFALFLLGILLFLSGSCQANDKPDWPRYVWDNMPVPHRAQNVKFAHYADTYQITYSMNVCYPPNKVIDGIADSFKLKGWQRLMDDPLDPGEKLSVAITPRGMTWKSHPWTDYWRDKSGNVVSYTYMYEIGKLPVDVYFKELEKSCSLKGAIIFYPPEVFKKTQEVMQKALEDKR
jgi:hypothetical protein